MAGTLRKFDDLCVTGYVVDYHTTNVTSGESPYTVTSEDQFIVVDTSGGAVTLNLPQISSMGTSGNYKRLTIKDNGGAGSNNITINRSGSDTIDGSTSVVLDQNYARMVIMASSSTWLIIENSCSISVSSGTIGSAVTATTQSSNDNSTKIATTAYVDAAGGGGGGGGSSVEYAVTGEGTFASSGYHSVTQAHGLSGTPQFVRWVLVCKTAEFGYSIGDEVEPVDSRVDTGTGSKQIFAISNTADATNVTIRVGSNAPVFYFNNKATQAVDPPTSANWKWKAYCMYVS